MTKNNIRVGHINVRSLLPKINTIKNFLQDNQYDILAVTETWLSPHVVNSLVNIEGYRLVRKDRDGRGGGVCFYVLNNLNFKLIERNDNIEQLWISVKIFDDVTIYGVVYRPQTVEYKYFLTNLEESVCNFIPICERLVILGDLNINLLDIDSSSAIYLNSVLETLGLTQIITKPTRITELTEALIDLIIISDTSVVLNSGNIELNISDHELVFCNLDINNKFEPYFITYRDFSAFNHNHFTNDLLTIPFHHIYTFAHVEQKVQYFNDCLINLFNLHAPYKTTKILKPRKPWITDNIKLLISLRDKAKLKFKKTKRTAHWEYYKQLRNYTEVAIKNEKRAYLNTKFRTNDSKVIWKELKSLNINKQKHSDLPLHLKNPNMINDYFINSIPKSDYNNNHLIDYYSNHTFGNIPANFDFTLVNEDTILQIMSQIKSNAMGSDSINLMMLKYCCPYIIPYITHIVNSCLLSNTFPSQWKQAYVIPIPKVSEPLLPKDLRPVSILPTLSKILERVIYIQLMSHLNNHEILPTHQSGFRRAHSCTTALLKVSDDILEASDNNKITALVLLDFTKAFDTIQHRLLISILHFIGLGKDAVSLLANYLDNRTQRVKIENNCSTVCSLRVGVPQGSILGPLLFSIYTSNFCNKLVHCTSHMYADDTQLYLSFENNKFVEAAMKINSDLNIIEQVSKEHFLFLNPVKSKLILFGNKLTVARIAENFTVKVNDTNIPIVHTSCNLGLNFDNSFRFTSQITKYIQKSYLALKLLYPHRNYLSEKIKTLLCESLVLSNFSYCAPVYYPCLDVLTKNRIQRTQNSCLRYIFGIRRREHISHKLKEIKWLNMNNRLKLQTLCLYHQVICSKTPAYLYNKIRFRSDIHNINVRNRNYITPPSHRTSLYERSFTFNISKYYNSVPINIKQQTVRNFKNHLSMYFYNSQ